MRLTTIPARSDNRLTQEKVHNRGLKIAWLAPSLARGWRWQTLFKEFTAIHPNTIIYTVEWPGCTRGFEGAFRIQKIPGLRYIGPQAEGDGRSRGFMWASPRILIDLLKFHPDIILTNGFHVWTLCAIAAQPLLKCRLVLLWQGVSPETGGETGTLRLRLRRWVSRHFDLAATNTHDGVDYLRSLVRIPAGRIQRFVGETASREAFAVATLGPSWGPLKKPVFLFAGSLITGKGVDRFLRACAVLASRGIDGFSVVIVGTGPQEKPLRQLARTLRIDRQIHWEGFVPYESLGAYYEHCDVFVLPSLEDTWGVAAMEAMAFGKPVLCSQRAGVNELVTHGVNGFLFDPNRPEQLASYMAELIQRPQLVADFGKASEAIAVQNSPAHAAYALSQIACGKADSPLVAKGDRLGIRNLPILPNREAHTDVFHFHNTDLKTDRR